MILAIGSAMICFGAMAACIRMVMKHAPSQRTDTPVPSNPRAPETDFHDD
jgi:hypothetical protein